MLILAVFVVLKLTKSVSLQARRLAIEKALAEIPNEESALREGFSKLRLSVDIMSSKIRDLGIRIEACEVDGKLNSDALRKLFESVESIYREPELVLGTTRPVSHITSHTSRLSNKLTFRTIPPVTPSKINRIR